MLHHLQSTKIIHNVLTRYSCIIGPQVKLNFTLISVLSYSLLTALQQCKIQQVSLRPQPQGQIFWSQVQGQYLGKDFYFQRVNISRSTFLTYLRWVPVCKSLTITERIHYFICYHQHIGIVG